VSAPIRIDRLRATACWANSTRPDRRKPTGQMLLLTQLCAIMERLKYPGLHPQINKSFWDISFSIEYLVRSRQYVRLVQIQKNLYRRRPPHPWCLNRWNRVTLPPLDQQRILLDGVSISQEHKSCFRYCFYEITSFFFTLSPARIRSLEALSH